jgi:hypothetical protein
MKDHFGTALKWPASAVGLAAAAYAAYVCVAWLRYGHPSSSATHEEADALLDRFLPDYEVVERHHIRVAAPAEITFRAACEADLMQSALIQAIFRAREIILGSEPKTAEQPQGLVALTRSLGWGVLAEVPGREIVMGAVTQPWQADVVFRPLAPDQFMAFHEPEYVKIAWTLRADAHTADQSVFRTETRVMTTDPAARAKFRRYWAYFSPGIWLIRWLSLRPLQKEAEEHARNARLRLSTSYAP